MNTKKWFVFLLSILLMLPMLAIPAAAAENPEFSYELTVDGLETKEAEMGDIVTVTMYLQRVDSDEPYTMYGMQSEIRYDSNFFELVEDSASLGDGVQSTDIGRPGEFREFYMNFVSLSGGVQWQPRTRIGSFQLKIIGTEGVSTITNEDFLVSLPDGSGGYACEANELTVILTTDCTVKFETNGGTSIDPITAIYGETISRPEDPAREGKHLVGWFKDIHLTEEWDFATDKVSGNMTLYAKWADAPVEPAEDTKKLDAHGCIICGRENTLIPGVPLCTLCLLLAVLILLILVLIICLIKTSRKPKKKGKFQH